MSQDDSPEILPAFPQDGLSQVFTDLTEVGLDSLLKEGIVRDIPVLGTIANAAKAGASIRDYLFARKVALFLMHLRGIPPQKKEVFCQKLQQNAEHQKRVGEALILLLDRLNDLDKPQLLAKIFEAYITEKITFEMFKRIGSAIDAAFIEDLKQIAQSDLGEETRQLCLRNLIPSGLSRISTTTGTTFGSIDIPVELTEAGTTYNQIMQAG